MHAPYFHVWPVYFLHCYTVSEELSKGENIVKWIKGQNIRWLAHLERMEEDRMPKKDLHSRTGRDETKRKTQERMERRSGKRSSSAGNEKMERVGDR